MRKTIVIIYRPGYGGNFLKKIFSLDLSTERILCGGSSSSNDSVAVRAHEYSYYNARKFQHWKDYHLSETPAADSGKTKVLLFHPHEIFLDMDAFLSIANDPHTVICVVNLLKNDFNNFWLVETKRRLKNFPILRIGEHSKEQQIRQKFKLLDISMDKFLYPSEWTSEYIRVSNLLGLPLQLEAATKLYNSWYDVRVAPLKAMFQSLTDLDKQRYTKEHKFAETYGNPGIPWKSYYASIRGTGWPDCEFESEFDSLPTWVQNEMTDIFNYKPGRG